MYESNLLGGIKYKYQLNCSNLSAKKWKKVGAH